MFLTAFVRRLFFRMKIQHGIIVSQEPYPPFKVPLEPFLKPSWLEIIQW